LWTRQESNGEAKLAIVKVKPRGGEAQLAIQTWI
jgi:hypothetical protein